MRNILIADDEEEIIRLLKIYLENEDCKVFAAGDGEEALRVLDKEPIDIALVDIMMPGKNGYEVIEYIRQHVHIPVIAISAKSSLGDKILGLELGADDYITKPFEPLEVAARVKAQLRKNDYAQLSDTEKTIRAGNASLDLETCMLSVDGEETELTKTEFMVLKLLMSHPKRVFTKEQIYAAGWEEDRFVDDNTIRVLISHLRDKVGQGHIKTIRGLGYRYEE